MQNYRDYRPDRRFQPTIALSPDGTRVAYSDNLSGQYNLVVVPVDATDASADRLTDSADSTVRTVAWSHDGQHLIFAADANGDEFSQVRRVAVGGGAVDSLTDAPGVQFELGDVSPDGRWISYGGNDREKKDQDVLVQDLTTGEVRRVFAEGGNVSPAGWAPDSTRMIVGRSDSNTEIVVFLTDIHGSVPEQIIPAKGEPATYAVPGPWLPDGSAFLLRTDMDQEFVGVARFDIETRTQHWLIRPDWDVEEVRLSEDGRLLVWTLNVGGISELHAAEMVGNTIGAEVPVPSLPPGQISALSLSADGGTLAALLVTGGRSTNVVVADMRTGEVRWLTDTLAAVTAKTVEPEVVSFLSSDGLEIPAWLYRPEGDGPFPVVLSIHGGPEAQERPAYNYGGLYQYLVANGIAVLAPNVRGSNGYGRTYQRLVLRDWGGGDKNDFEAAAQFLQRSPWAISDKIGVFGGSYGGFATLTCLSRLPDYFACGVDIVGPSNLVTLARSVPPTWRAMIAAWIGDPDTEADFLMSRSPITYADQIVAPLFVIQGANDPRVNKAESDGIVEALRARGVDVRYDVYDDEGHGFTRKENEAKAMGDSADFLIQHLT